MTNLEQVTHTFHLVAIVLSPAPNNRIDILVQAAGVVGQTSILTHQVNEENFDFGKLVLLLGLAQARARPRVSNYFFMLEDQVMLTR